MADRNIMLSFKFSLMSVHYVVMLNVSLFRFLFTAYDGSVTDWEEYSRYLNPDEMPPTVSPLFADHIGGILQILALY